MKTFLLVAGGVVAGLFLFLVIGYWWLKRKVKGLVDELGGAMEALAGLGTIPPFRINLEEEVDGVWGDKPAMESITNEMNAINYQLLGDYTVDEIPGLHLRAFWHEKLKNFAVIYGQGETISFADFVVLIGDTYITVTSNKDNGLDKPSFTQVVRVAMDLNENPMAVKELHQRLVDEIGDSEVTPWEAAMFRDEFTEAYKKEMNWRIQRGGITADEVRRSAVAGGQPEPSEEEVSMVLDLWKETISEQLNEDLQEEFLKQTQMTAAEWEERRYRLCIVHKESSVEGLIDSLMDHIVSYDDDDDLYDEKEKELRNHFEGEPVMAAFESVLDLLPANKKYEKLGVLEHPVPAVVFLEPEPV